MKKINLHELVLWIVDEHRVKFKEQIIPIDYYISWKTGMLVIVDQIGNKIYFHHESYLKNWGLELDESV